MEELRRVYDNDVDQLDLMIGMYAENPPRGFAFSDTAFRIFVLKASRRLNSDRFLTTDYNERVYTKTGIEWVNDTDMFTVLLRHVPQSLRNRTGILQHEFAVGVHAFSSLGSATPRSGGLALLGRLWSPRQVGQHRVADFACSRGAA